MQKRKCDEEGNDLLVWIVLKLGGQSQRLVTSGISWGQFVLNEYLLDFIFSIPWNVWEVYFQVRSTMWIIGIGPLAVEAAALVDDSILHVGDLYCVVVEYSIDGIRWLISNKSLIVVPAGRAKGRLPHRNPV